MCIFCQCPFFFALHLFNISFFWLCILWKWEYFYCFAWLCCFYFIKFGFGLLLKCGSISIIDLFPQTHHPASLSVLGMLRFANALLKVSIGSYLLLVQFHWYYVPEIWLWPWFEVRARAACLFQWQTLEVDQFSVVSKENFWD